MKKCTTLVLVLLSFGLTLFAQNTATKTIKGKVLDDSSGLALPDATVTIQKKAVKTDASGSFTAKIPDDGKKYEVTVSYAGYSSKTVNTDGSGDIAIRLKREVNQIEDVVVIGYQTVRRKDVLASVASVGAKELKDIPITSAAEALNGRLAGVTATTAEGSPDAAVTIKVRGGGSITQDNSPLYIIDGVQVESGLAGVVLQDIQNIDVLKDAAATAIYGARGANGVIIITTKSGKPGKMKVVYNGAFGIKTLAKELDVLNPFDFVMFEYERTRPLQQSEQDAFAKRYGSYWDTLAVYKNITPVDWQKEVLGQTGFSQLHNIGLSGGNKKSNYNFSYTRNDDKAIVLNSKFKRNQFNLKGEHKFSNKLKINASARYTNQNVYGAGISDDRGSAYSRLRNSVKFRPFLLPNESLDDVDPDASTSNGLTLKNPIKLVNQEYRKKTSNTLNLSGSITYNITKNLTFKSTLGYERGTIYDRQFSDTLSYDAIQNGGGLPLVSLDSTTKKTLTNSNVVTYSKKAIGGKHDIDVLLGEETFQLETDVNSYLYTGFKKYVDHTYAIENANALGTLSAAYPKLSKAKATQLSFFGRVNYSFDKKYLFSFNMRADGSSKFFPGRQWAYFPAGSFAWRISNENFMKNVKGISDLKLRLSYGTVGNNRIADYLFLTTFGNTSYYYGLNGQLITSYNSTSLVNELLKWETTVNRGMGLDLSLLKGKLDISIDYYNNSTKDLLLNVPIASTYGYSLQQQNVGKTSNKGFELQLTALVMKKKDFTWSTNFNFSTNRNRVEAVGVGNTYVQPDKPSWGVAGQAIDYRSRVGDPVGSMYGYVTDGFYTVNDFNTRAVTPGDPNTQYYYTLKSGVVSDSALFNSPVQPGTIKFKDIDGDGVITDKDRQVIGNPTPKFTGGLNQQFTYKSWDMSIFLNFSYGGNVYNANKIEFTNSYTPSSNVLAVMKDRWKTIDDLGNLVQSVQPTGVGSNKVVVGIDPTKLASLNANASIWQSNSSFLVHSWAIEDASFLRINNITIGYTLPVKTMAKLHMSRLRFYATVNNLAVITGYSGYDPEVSVRSNPLTPALDYSAYPKSRSFILGINASF